MSTASVNIEIFCKECKANTEMVVDHVAGDVICRSCGTVQVERYLDEGQDWRTFASDGADFGAKVDSRDRTAGNGMCNDELLDDVTGTVVSGSSKLAETLQKAHSAATSSAASGKSDTTLTRLRKDMRDVAKLLNLSEQILKDCEWILKKMLDAGTCKKTSLAFFCAVAYLACLDAGETRTIGEIAHTCLPTGRKEDDFKKDIAKVVKKLMKDRNPSATSSEQQASHPTWETHIRPLLSRACARLQISVEVECPAAHLTEMVYQFGFGESLPAPAVAAMALLVIAWLYDVEHKPWFAEVAAAARVSAGKVKTSYQKIKPYLGNRHKDGRGLLPQDFDIRLRGGLEALPPANAVDPCGSSRLMSAAPSSAPSSAVVAAATLSPPSFLGSELFNPK